MAGVTEALRVHRRVGIDSALFIYHLEDAPHYSELAAELFMSLDSGTHQGVTSAFTLLEIIVKPLRIGRPDIADEYERIIEQQPNLAIVDLTRDAIRRAAELRATYGIRPPDAFQLAACLQFGATVFVTSDLRLRSIRELEVVVLDDFIE